MVNERESLSFWNNVDYAMTTNKEIKSLQDLFSKVTSIQQSIQDLIALKDLYKEQNEQCDIKFLDDAYKQLIEIKANAENLKILTLLNGKYDDANAIISIHSGAGGTEAQDWVEMLFRMYSMYSNKSGYETEVLDKLEGNEAGLKNITFVIRGDNAYGKLRSEMGVHRLVRISPFDAAKKRHTSFASVEVVPELTKGSDVKINSEDLKIDTYKSGGAGGQHVNKTESAIRITHIPTNTIVCCQNQRSQLQNREQAMRILVGKLIALQEENNKKDINELKGDLGKIEWGNQIRSYVFQPYTMVKDHRTDYETSDVVSVMNGEIDEFINAYLKYKKVEK